MKTLKTLAAAAILGVSALSAPQAFAKTAEAKAAVSKEHRLFLTGVTKDNQKDIEAAATAAGASNVKLSAKGMLKYSGDVSKDQLVSAISSKVPGVSKR